MTLRRFFALTMSLMLLIGIWPVQAAETGFQPFCFEGPADYSYQDEGLSVAIKRYQQNDIVYFVADVQVKQAKQLMAGLSSDKPNGREEKMQDIAARSGAVLAINGDYYGAHKFGTIIRNA